MSVELWLPFPELLWFLYWHLLDISVSRHMVYWTLSKAVHWTLSKAVLWTLSKMVDGTLSKTVNRPYQKIVLF